MSPNPSIFGQPYYMGDLFIFTSGICLSLMFCNSIALFRQYGTNFSNRTSILQLINTIAGFCMVFTSAMSLMINATSCSAVILATVFYQTAEISVDAILLVRMLATFGLNPSPFTKAAWIAVFLLLDVTTRVAHVSLNTYSFIPDIQLCTLVLHVSSALIESACVFIYLAIAGGVFAKKIFDLSKTTSSSLMQDVGIKSTVLTIILIVFKIALYIPAATNSLNTYSSIFLFFQTTSQSILLTICTQWTLNKDDTVTSGLGTRQKSNDNFTNSGSVLGLAKINK